MYSLAGPRTPDVELIWSTTETPVDRTAMTEKVSTGAQQGVYLFASVALIQFNAIVAAIQGSLLTFSADLPLKAGAAGALLLHVLAASVLCWAARPITTRTRRGLSIVDDYRHAPDTFRNYRRGWRMTLLALAGSALSAALFMLQAFGIAIPVLVYATWLE